MEQSRCCVLVKYLCKTVLGTSVHAEMSVGNNKVKEAAPPTTLLFNKKKKSYTKQSCGQAASSSPPVALA